MVTLYSLTIIYVGVGTEKQDINMPAPVILFAYNRPAHIRRCIESLLANSEAALSDLFIYSDGAKGESDGESVKAVREFLRTVSGFKSVNLIERERNFGLSANVIDAVTRIVNEYGNVIVVEDDLTVSPHFLEFMNDALEIYRDIPQVGHIQACDFTGSKKLPDTFLIKWTGSWGWATWARAWQLFNPDGKQLLQELEEKKLTRSFDFNGAYGFTKMLRNQIEGKNDSWAIRWNASLFLRGILSLNAGRSLIMNNGFDGSGTNCGAEELYKSKLYMGRLPVVPISPIVENEDARAVIKDYYRRTNSFQAKALRRIKRLLKGDFRR